MNKKNIAIALGAAMVFAFIAISGFNLLKNNDGSNQTATIPETKAATTCTVDAKLVNSCRPWLSAATAFYSMAGGNATDLSIQFPFFEKRLNNPNVLTNPNDPTTITKQLDFVHFYNGVGKNSIQAAALPYVNRANTYLQLNWKPADPWSLAGGGDATTNAGIATMANNIKALAPKKILLTIYHEPEDNITSGSAGSCYTKSTGTSGSPTDYVNMWRNVRKIFDDNGVTNVVWNMNYMGFSNWDCVVPLIWPGNSYVDWVTWDAYAGGTATFASSVQPFYTFLSTKGDATHDYMSKPWGLSEFGYWNQNGNSTETQAPIYWQQAKAAIQNNTFPKIKLYSVFDTTPDYATPFPTGASFVGLNFGAFAPNVAEQTAFNDFATTLFNTGSGTVTPPAPTGDVTGPTAPTNLTATSKSYNNVTLSWGASTDDSGSVATYIVKRNNVDIGTVTGTTLTYQDKTVSASTSYSYLVVAKDAAGNTGPTSNTLQLTTPAAPDTAAPSAPSNLVAKSNAYNSVTIGWAASTDNVGVINYQIKRSGVVIGSVPGTALSFVDDTVSSQTAYSYQVTAGDAAGNTSTGSNTLQLTTPAQPDTTAPTAPSNVVATAPSYNKVNITWGASTDNKGVSGYYVVRNGVTVASATGTSYADSTVSPKTNYSYSVIAYDAAGNTSASAAVSVSTPDVPDTSAPSVPQSIKATAVSSTQINLTWGASTDNVGVVSYKVTRNGTLVATVSASAGTSYGDANLASSTNYSYTLSACDAANNCSAQSVQAVATTPAVVTVQAYGKFDGVVSNSNGTKISKVKVRTVNATNTFTTYTSTSGYWWYGSLPVGPYQATFSKTGYATTVKSVNITSDQKVRLFITLTK